MHVIIPARYAAIRLPGKPLLEIAGKPLIQRVYECAQRSGAESVTIATDDERIKAAATAFGAEVCLTDSKHPSGTDRLAEAVKKLGLDKDDIVVNLQGDEPMMPAGLITQVAESLAQHEPAVMATACCPIESMAELTDPHVVKVVIDHNGYALFFSRAAVPWQQSDGQQPDQAYRHIGLYAYRAGFLDRYAAWPPCKLEQAERLEQLRVLWYGEKIAVCRARELPGHGIDTEADLARARAHFSALNSPRKTRN